MKRLTEILNNHLDDKISDKSSDKIDDKIKNVNDMSNKITTNKKRSYTTDTNNSASTFYNWQERKSNYNRFNKIDHNNQLQPIANKKRRINYAQQLQAKNKVSLLENKNKDKNDDSPSEAKTTTTNTNSSIDKQYEIIKSSYKLPLDLKSIERIINHNNHLDNKNNNGNKFDKFDKYQLDAMKSILLKKNTFLVGGCKSGKTSVLLKMQTILETMKIKYVYLSGSLSHTIENAKYNCQYLKKWLYNIDPSLKSEDSVLSKLGREMNARFRFQNLEVILLDDIASTDSRYLKVLDVVLKLLHYNRKMFGGVCVVVAADLAQISPLTNYYSTPEQYMKIPLFFETVTWRAANFNECYLSNNYRHSREFAKFLERFRLGKVTNEDILMMRKCVTELPVRQSIPDLKNLRKFNQPIKFDVKFSPVRLFNNRNQVISDRSNVNSFMLKGAVNSKTLNYTFSIVETVKQAHNTIHQKMNDVFQKQVQESYFTNPINLYTGIQVYTTVDIHLPVVITTDSKSESLESLELLDSKRSSPSSDKEDKSNSNPIQIETDTDSNKNNNIINKSIIIPRGSIGVLIGWTEPEIISDNYGKNLVNLPIVQLKHRKEPVTIYPINLTNNLNCNVNEIVENDSHHQSSNRNVSNNGTNVIMPGMICSQIPLAVGWSAYLDEEQPQAMYDDIFLVSDNDNFIDSKYFYNAICRVNYFEGIKLEVFDDLWLKLDSRITKFYSKLHKKQQQDQNKKSADQSDQIDQANDQQANQAHTIIIQ